MTKELGNWDLPPDALPRALRDKLDRLVEIRDDRWQAGGWDREMVLESLISDALLREEDAK